MKERFSENTVNYIYMYETRNGKIRQSEPSHLLTAKYWTRELIKIKFMYNASFFRKFDTKSSTEEFD